jgi:uncharacterized protein involved in outer membrane biogenesis
MRWTGAALGVVLLAGIVAPFVHADRFKGQIHAALERAIHRKVEFEDVRFNLLTGPGFSIDKVVIHEDPAIGIEPVAYVSTLRAGIRFWSLWTGRLEFNAVVLEEASINVAKTDRGRSGSKANPHAPTGSRAASAISAGTGAGRWAGTPSDAST